MRTNDYHLTTPGPWTYESGMVWTEEPTPDMQFVPIAKMDRDTEYTSPAERDANAKLIAGSQDMYEYIAHRAENGDGEAQDIINTIWGIE